MEKGHLLNFLAGLIIIGIWIFNITIGSYPALPLTIIALFIVSYVMERKGINAALWGTLTSLLLVFSLWTMVPRIFFWP